MIESAAKSPFGENETNFSLGKDFLRFLGFSPKVTIDGSENKDSL